MDETADVLGRLRAIHPRQPLAEILAVTVGDGEDSLGIARLQQPDFDARRDGPLEYGGTSVHGFSQTGLEPRKTRPDDWSSAAG